MTPPGVRLPSPTPLFGKLAPSFRFSPRRRTDPIPCDMSPRLS